VIEWPIKEFFLLELWRYGCFSEACLRVHDVILWVHDVILWVHVVILRVHDVILRVHDVILRVHDVILRVHDVIMWCMISFHVLIFIMNFMDNEALDDYIHKTSGGI
jgi:hypothetical protein